MPCCEGNRPRDYKMGTPEIQTANLQSVTDALSDYNPLPLPPPPALFFLVDFRFPLALLLLQ